MSKDEIEVEYQVPAGASEAEKAKLEQAALDEKIDGDIDDVLSGLGI